VKVTVQGNRYFVWRGECGHYPQERVVQDNKFSKFYMDSVALAGFQFVRGGEGGYFSDEPMCFHEYNVIINKAIQIVGKPPRNSAGFFWRRPRPKLGCGAKERRRINKAMGTVRSYETCMI
jgi:hypothetical protein